MGMVVRCMREGDLAAVHAVQCRAHPGHYHEPPEALASHLSLGPDFCLVAEENGEVLAYFLAHPWRGDPPPLHEGLPAHEERGRLAEMPVHLFLHDLAVCPQHQGRALGRILCDTLFRRAAAHGFGELRLVAVGAASRYWGRLGFSPLAGHPLHASYGQAVLMGCRIPAMV